MKSFHSGYDFILTDPTLDKFTATRSARKLYTSYQRATKKEGHTYRQLLQPQAIAGLPVVSIIIFVA